MTEEQRKPLPISSVEMRYRGPQGERGERGMPGTMFNRSIARSVVFLFLLAVSLSVVCLFWISHAENSAQAALKRLEQKQQQEQQQAGALVVQKLCATLGKLAALKPPAGSAVNNPSRAYEQHLHATLDGLGPDIGCPRTTAVTGSGASRLISARVHLGELHVTYVLDGMSSSAYPSP